MIANPYFLSGIGIILVIVGFILAWLSRSAPPRDGIIHHEIRHKEIRELLQPEERMPFPNQVIVFGMLCILASVVWRLAKNFV